MPIGDSDQCKLQIKVISVNDAGKSFLSPFPKIKQEFARASIVGRSGNKLSIVNAKRMNSLKKTSNAFLSSDRNFQSNMNNREEELSLLDVRISPLRGKITKDWESESSIEEVKQEEVVPAPDTLKVNTLEQFYEQRKSKLNPVNIMLTQRK